jgi:DNA polymerase V
VIFALVDCNNFYVSCERIFRPLLEDKPVIVLSNNDGCVISRSEEAKKLGIKMGIPAFEITDTIEKNKVYVFSSNYTLYGDISQRVMSVLSQLAPEIEIYSIDEAFLRIDGIKQFTPKAYAERIKKIIKQWTGVPVSVGVGQTKTLAKAANYLAKKNKELNGVFDFTSAIDADQYLTTVPVGEIWGVGEKYESMLLNNSIITAKDLKYAAENWVRSKMRVIGARTLKELNGISCIPIEDVSPAHKALCISRSYGRPTEIYEDIEQATSAFVARTAEKLRKHNLLASQWTVFVMTNRFAKGPRYVNFKTITLPVPTNDTAELNAYTVKLLQSLFRKGYRYKKSGVIAENLIPEDQQQTALWDHNDRKRYKTLMKTVDRINAGFGRDTIKFAIQGMNRNWKMRQEKLSPDYTTKWSDILKIDL